MAATEMTISEALRDPMIRLMLRADHVSLEDFTKLLEEAATSERQVAHSIKKGQFVRSH